MGKIFPPIDFTQHDTSISFSESISSAVFATLETLKFSGFLFKNQSPPPPPQKGPFEDLLIKSLFAGVNDTGRKLTALVLLTNGGQWFTSGVADTVGEFFTS